MSDFSEEKTERKLDILRKKEEEENTQKIAQINKLPYADITTFPVETDAIKLIPEDQARHAALAAFQVSGVHLKVAIHNPKLEETRQVLEDLKKSGFIVEAFIVSRSSLEHTWNLYKKIPKEHKAPTGIVQISSERLRELKEELTTIDDIKKLIIELSGGRVTELLEVLLAGALKLDASDVHIEPQESEIRIRFRLDGMLHDIILIEQRPYLLTLSRIKLISELKLNIHNKSQDGRFTIKIDHTEIEVRVSILPGPNGENIVLRILNPEVIRLRFDDLGMQPWVISQMETELKKPNGMILTTGPTGSGKTTTLYAFLQKIHSPEIKIITIEDPIEYHLLGVEQTQVNTDQGYDFGNGLKAIVRQDPDVILVGEIRDLETAETAMHASLTGHLVFSTIHTNSAAGTIPRLLDLGVKPSIIAPAINVAIGQRLLRKLCLACRIPTEVAGEEKEKIKTELNLFPKNIPIPQEKDWKIFGAAAGSKCRECNGLGYKGRMGVFEIILINDKVEHLILKDPSEFEIKKEAAAQNQITMRQDGILKVLAGIIDFAEVERVVGAAEN